MLFLSFFPFLLISVSVQSGLLSNFNRLQVFYISSIFLFMEYSGHIIVKTRTKKWFQIVQYRLSVCFIIVIISSITVQKYFPNSVLIFITCFFFPFFLLSVYEYAKKNQVCILISDILWYIFVPNISLSMAPGLASTIQGNY